VIALVYPVEAVQRGWTDAEVEQEFEKNRLPFGRKT
jgi:hypothetical protein